MTMAPIAVLDIGTTRTRALIGELDGSQELVVTGVGEYPSTGVRKGHIIDFEQAKVGVLKAVEQAAQASDVDVGRLLVSVSGGHVVGVVNEGTTPVRSSGQIVSRDDVEEVTELAESFSLPDDRQVINRISQTYSLDGESGIVKPVGLHGSRLSLSVLVLHGLRAQVDNIYKLVQSVDMSVVGIAFGGICAALSTLTAEQKRAGAVVIDLGGGTTDYLAYANNIIAKAGSFGVGGDHVTNDLALAFNLRNASAERLKRASGQAVVGAGSALKRLTIPRELGLEERSASLKSFHVVINARMAETLRLIRKELVDADLLSRLGAGVVFTGGGAAMPGLLELAGSIFQVPCQVGSPRNIRGFESIENAASFATAAGLVIYGYRTAEQTGIFRPVSDFFRRIFRR